VFFTETFRVIEDANRGTRSGFDNLVIGTQYQLYTNPEHQFVVTVGGTAAIGGTGAPGIASSFSTLTPTVYIGKGFGDLPDSAAWLRPLTISATAAVAVPTDASTLTSTSLGSANLPVETGAFNSLTTLPTGPTTLAATVNPKILQLGFALEYSLVTNQYTGPNRTGTRYPEGWVPLVEFTTSTPLNGPLGGPDDRHGQSGRHLGEPLSPGRGGGDHPDGCPFGSRPRCARTGPPVSSRDLSRFLQ
jgi:hypothetical protein